MPTFVKIIIKYVNIFKKNYLSNEMKLKRGLFSSIKHRKANRYLPKRVFRDWGKRSDLSKNHRTYNNSLKKCLSVLKHFYLKIM